MTNRPITPPFGLVRQWIECTEYDEHTWFYEMYIAEQAAQWGADQQLAEDADWLNQHALDAPHLKITPVGEVLKETMRSKPLSLKKQALQALKHAPGPDYPNPITLLTANEHALIRRALEQLND